jgi:CheY-like chemotaxis protein
VVLLDIGLPLLNGHEVARRIRAECWGKHILLIATTGWSTQADIERSRAAGFDHHLVKPVDPEELRRLIQSPSSEPESGTGPSTDAQ